MLLAPLQKPHLRVTSKLFPKRVAILLTAQILALFEGHSRSIHFDMPLNWQLKLSEPNLQVSEATELGIETLGTKFTLSEKAG